MSRVFDVVLEFLEEQGWTYSVLEDREVAQARFGGDGGSSFTFFADARPDRPVLLCYSVRDERVPEERRAAVAELLTRLNYPLLVGSFDMDFADGEVRFRSSVDFEGDEPSAALVRNVVLPNLQAMNTYQPAIEAVAAGEAPAEERLAP